MSYPSYEEQLNQWAAAAPSFDNLQIVQSITHQEPYSSTLVISNRAAKVQVQIDFGMSKIVLDGSVDLDPRVYSVVPFDLDSILGFLVAQGVWENRSNVLSDNNYYDLINTPLFFAFDKSTMSVIPRTSLESLRKTSPTLDILVAEVIQGRIMDGNLSLYIRVHIDDVLQVSGAVEKKPVVIQEEVPVAQDDKLIEPVTAKFVSPKSAQAETKTAAAPATPKSGSSLWMVILLLAAAAIAGKKEKS